MELLGAGAGAIALRERGTDELLFRSVVGPVSDKLHRARTSMSKGILGWVSAQRQPLIVQEPQRDGRHDRELADLLGYIPRNLICVPLIAESDVMGALELLDKKDARPFDENDRKLLSLIAGQVSRAIQLARASRSTRLNSVAARPARA